MTAVVVAAEQSRACVGLHAPGPTVVLLAGTPSARAVPWGQPWQAGTPAHWCALSRYGVEDGLVTTGPFRHRLGRDLAEEVAACLLGGFGMPYEVGLAAFHLVREEGLLSSGASASAAELEAVLRRPLRVGGSVRRYRFPRQRAHRLTGALAFLRQEPPPSEPVAVRDWLLRAPGVGPKTASWVVRNHYGSDAVAVLDVHVLRAGVAAGVFDPEWTPGRHYRVMEQLFLAWARQGDVSAADLDAVIWAEQAAAVRRRADRGAR